MQEAAVTLLRSWGTLRYSQAGEALEGREGFLTSRLREREHRRERRLGRVSTEEVGHKMLCSRVWHVN